MTARESLLLAAVCLWVIACGRDARPDPAAATRSAPNPPASAAPAGTHLRVADASFLTAEGHPFQWRGITAFRLLDYVAEGREGEAETYMAWAREQKLTVLRVLAMGGSFMDLKPADGRASLPRLLVLARKHNLHVEVVALADTRSAEVDLDEQLSLLGKTLGEHPNALLEVANEPTHPTHAAAVGKPEILVALARRVPADVPVALGSVEAGESFAGPDYVTWHAPRHGALGGWGHVLGLAQGAEFVRKFRKPVVSDEPIGAGPKYEAGRRDDDPSRFRAAALLTRLTGVGATFHYEGGLQARIPEGRELECFRAWNEAWTLLPPDVEVDGQFASAGSADAVVRDFDRQAAFGVFERIAGRSGWVLAVGPGDPALQLATGWKVSEARTLEGVRLLRVSRS